MKIQKLPRHRPPMVRLECEPSTQPRNVLPAELIGDAETVVGGGIHGIEGAMYPVLRTLIARSKVVLTEDTRMSTQIVEPVSHAEIRSPRVDTVRPVGATLLNSFERVIHLPYDLAFEPQPICLFVLPACFAGSGLDRNTRLHTPEKKRLKHGVTIDIFDVPIGTVNVITFPMMAYARVTCNNCGSSEDAES